MARAYKHVARKRNIENDPEAMPIHHNIASEILKKAKVGQDVIVVIDTKYYPTKIVQINSSCLFVNWGKRIKCINVADLVTREVRVLGILKPNEYEVKI